jgi:hypothetical protein
MDRSLGHEMVRVWKYLEWAQAEEQGCHEVAFLRLIAIRLLISHVKAVACAWDRARQRACTA